MQRIFGKLCRKHTRIQFEPVNRVQPFHCGHNHFWHRLSIWTGTNKSYYLYMHALHSHPAIMAVSLAPQTIVLFISSFIPYMYIYCAVAVRPKCKQPADRKCRMHSEHRRRCSDVVGPPRLCASTTF